MSGTSTGIHLVDDSTNTKVIYCVNHDVVAIESHRENHPYCKHLVEDVRDMRVVQIIKAEVERLRKEDPTCIINIWASLECTNYSKAKGGLPRDADSRTLAHALYMYIEELNPDYLYIENVREFMAWGPLDSNGRPISRKNGTDYVKWCNKIQRYGFNYEFKLLNAADFGAYTSRLRYFGQFSKKGMPVSWPQPTHAKKVNKKKDLFENTLEQWKAVKDVLDLEDEGESIFTRKKPIVPNTLKRIHAGLIKFVAGGEDMFIQKYFSGRPMGKVISMNSPAGSVTTIGGQSPVFIKRLDFIQKNYSGDPKHLVSSLNEPAGTITTIDHHSLVSTQFLAAYYSTGKNISSIDSPCPVVTTKDRFAKIQPVFIDQQFGNSKPSTINKPINTITANPKYNLVTTKPWIMDTSFNNVGSSINEPSKVITASHHYHYLMNPLWGGSCHSIEKPSPVIVARQDKAPMYVIGTEYGDNPIPIYYNEAPEMMQIKMFMNAYGIIDIKMRALKILELLQIQGFPKDYRLKGTQTEQKKFIGNAVEVNQARSIIHANSNAIYQHVNKAA